MKAPQFYTTLALGALCLILSVTTIVLEKANSNLQLEQQKQQPEIYKGNVAQGLLRDIAELSLRNDKIKQALAANGMTVNAPAAPAPASSPSATPSPSPEK